MLHLESFLEELDQFEGVFYCSDAPVTIPKIDLLKLITLMKISNSLEEIAESVSVDQNMGGISDSLNDLGRVINSLENTIINK